MGSLAASASKFVHQFNNVNKNSSDLELLKSSGNPNDGQVGEKHDGRTKYKHLT